MNPNEPLPDSRPITLAAAFLSARGYGKPILRPDEVHPDNPDFSRVIGATPEKLRHWREDFYLFDTVAYEKLHPENLRMDLNAFLNQQRVFKKGGEVVPLPVNEKLKRDVWGQLRDICQAPVESIPAWLNCRIEPEPKDVIAFRNGLLDVVEWSRDPEISLLPITPDWFSVNVLSCRYEPGARCTQWLSFLKGCLEGDEALIDLLQEWFGYCLTADTSRQKLLWLHGVSGAGKSTVTSVLQRVVGTKNTVRFDLWDFAYQFGLAKFLGKRVAISADAHLGTGNEGDKVLAKLKQITGDDETAVNRKNRDEIESIKLLTRFVICTNEFPALSDASDAITRRAMFVPFNRSFKGQEDPHLLDRLTGELQGITMWALEGLSRLLANGRFRDAGASRETQESFRRMQSAVYAFGEDCCELPDADATPDQVRRHYSTEKDDVYHAFCHWAKENQRQVMSKDRFASKLMRAFPSVKPVRVREGEKQRGRLYIGIRLNEETAQILVSSQMKGGMF